MSAAPTVLLAAGGTGGHLFPAEALANALARRDVTVDLVTDRRAAGYAGAFPARARHAVASATVRGRDPLSLARTGLTLAWGIAGAFFLLGRLKPDIVVGFGGYPTLPPVLAATWRGIPTLIHEQNGVPGRANRFLAPRVTRIATGFPDVFAAEAALAAKAAFTGNPTRPAAAEAGRAVYDPPTTAGSIRLVVFGGSQGARVMSEVVPAALASLPDSLRLRLSVVQQARPEDRDAVLATYAAAGIAAEVEPFFKDLPARIGRAHLVISRAGASTVAELAVIGRPSILVPLPHALDQDQMANARALADAGGAIVVPQAVFTADSLAARLRELVRDPSQLAAMAISAGAMGRPDAAERLADLVLATARARS